MSTHSSLAAVHRLTGWTLDRVERCDNPDCQVWTFTRPGREYARYLHVGVAVMDGLDCHLLPADDPILLRIETAKRMARLPLPRLSVVDGGPDGGSAA